MKFRFQDFIVARKMGKTGPLYEFDAAGDVRIHQGRSVDVAQSHPVKVGGLFETERREGGCYRKRETSTLAGKKTY